MTRPHRPILFLDTETLGLGMDDPIWELAAVHRDVNGHEHNLHLFIDHNPNDVSPLLPEAFRDDYNDRFNPDLACPPEVAGAALLALISMDDATPTLAESNPSFDAARIVHQLLADGLQPWHDHLLDIPTLALGFWHRIEMGISPGPETAPSTSDAISWGVGLDPTPYGRHTAMGDVTWCRDLHDLVTGYRSVHTMIGHH